MQDLYAQGKHDEILAAVNDGLPQDEAGGFVAGRERSDVVHDLLAFLAENPGIVFSKDTLFERVWGLEAAGDTATVMVHVNRIREKIEPDTIVRKA